MYSAQFDSPSDAGVDIFTPAKVDKFSGSIGFNFADSRLDARDPFLGSVVPSQSREYSFNLSAPVGKNLIFTSILHAVKMTGARSSTLLF